MEIILEKKEKVYTRKQKLVKLNQVNYIRKNIGVRVDNNIKIKTIKYE
jgi:hypothetical protein